MVVAFAPKFVAVPDAPDSWDKLKAWADDVGYDGPLTPDIALPVWSGASDSVCWGNDVNYAFRAWHDYTHLTEGHDFSREGEQAVALSHLRVVASHAADIIDRLGAAGYLAVLRIIVAETEGQQEYYARHGDFPVDQDRFTRTCVIQGIEAACAARY
jgi:hypothetical protein